MKLKGGTPRRKSQNRNDHHVGIVNIMQRYQKEFNTKQDRDLENPPLSQSENRQVGPCSLCIRKYNESARMLGRPLSKRRSGRILPVYSGQER